MLPAAAVVTIVVAAVTARAGVDAWAAGRSRCPAARAGEQRMALLVDGISTRPVGTPLDVAYDVCGLPPGRGFRTRLSLVGRGSVATVRTGTASLLVDEFATGPAMRRRRTLDVRGLPPGPYTLFLMVLDEDGRRRDEEVDFTLTPR